MVTMYDAGFGNAPKIPEDAQAVAGHGFTPALWARWPKAAHVTIAHSPADVHADVVDFEPGGSWVWGIPNLRRWLKGHQQATGEPGTVYVNRKRIWMVRSAAAGLRQPWIWASDQTGQPHMVSGPGVVATQWWGSTAARRAGQAWNGVDISEVSNLGAITGGRSSGGGGSGGSGGGDGSGVPGPPPLWLGSAPLDQPGQPGAQVAGTPPPPPGALFGLSGGVLILAGAVVVGVLVLRDKRKAGR